MTDVSLPPANYRIILLGASNLTLSLPRLVTSLRSGLPGSVEILAAAGHGRSYLGWSHFVHRGFPGVRDCALWETLEQRPPATHTYAMFTDLGCDLFYGAKPHQIIDAVSVCMNRLRELNAETVYVRPPLRPLNKISEWRYYIVKNFFFPGPTVPWKTMKEYITEVDAGVHQLAKEFQFATVDPKDVWYGFDPIHIRQRHRDSAWREILTPWDLEPPPAISPSTWGQALYFWSRRSAEQSLFRVIKRAYPQPVVKWDDGSSLSMF